MANVIGSGIARTLVDVDGDPVTVTGTALDVNIASGSATIAVALDSADDSVECIQDTASALNATIGNAIGNAVYTRITDGSGVAAVNGDNELSVEINNIDGSAGTMTVKPAIISSATNTKVSVGTGTTEIAASVPGRFSIDIVNDSDEIVYLGLEDNAVLNEGIRLNPNGGSYSSNIFTGIINGIAAKTANVTVAYTYVSS